MVGYFAIYSYMRFVEVKLAFVAIFRVGVSFLRSHSPCIHSARFGSHSANHASSHVFHVGVEVGEAWNLCVVGNEQRVGARGQQLLGNCPRHRQPLSI